jgi:hypothetical protein
VPIRRFAIPQRAGDLVFAPGSETRGQVSCEIGGIGHKGLDGEAETVAGASPRPDYAQIRSVVYHQVPPATTIAAKAAAIAGRARLT